MKRIGLTVRGRSLLAGGIATAVCALVLDERDLLRIGLFVCLLPVVSLLLAIRTRRAVQVTRTLAPERVSAGGSAQVALDLSGGPVFGALRLADTVPDAAGPVPATPPRFTVHRIGSRGARVTYPLVPPLRGAHRIGPLAGRAVGALGLAEFTREMIPADRLLVVPQVVPLRGAPRALGSGEGIPGAAAQQGQGSPDVMVRTYRQGDELRRVHWRSTARHDELMVRLEERPWHAGVSLLLDRRDHAHRGHGTGASLEYAVTLVASIAAHLIRRGEPLKIVTEDGVPLADPASSAGGAGLDPLLDALAVLRPVARPDLSGPPTAPGRDVVAVLGALTPEDAGALAARHPGGGYAILLDTPTWAGAPASEPAAAEVLRRAGWHVTVATARTTPAEAWSALVAGAPVGAR
ncbi:DUF58 domain-containing protein [Pseudonocardia oroxyli]|uniref:Uncharacterized conserved protein, DUF58 family, contains vWF domain n=1 Tax=Pseudonocardia oroxyli TaxID=366584 RepID=A0A1G7EKX8_PSEOR|nr:DUF58 domain-containing protein [Pseudonocardia oroxyli]SDE64308.1 Uncharacterized conserved protein, DUF58 family, contains vWF domain [Pseudonocardia oroxyli]